jgi:hypothetical protein
MDRSRRQEDGNNKMGKCPTGGDGDVWFVKVIMNSSDSCFRLHQLGVN